MTTTPSTRPVYQVTTYGNPDEILDSQYFDRGTYKSWLHWECERWIESGREAWLKESEEGQVALFTWAEYMKPVVAEES
jgi:hypothetical protein